MKKYHYLSWGMITSPWWLKNVIPKSTIKYHFRIIMFPLFRAITCLNLHCVGWEAGRAASPERRLDDHVRWRLLGTWIENYMISCLKIPNINICILYILYIFVHRFIFMWSKWFEDSSWAWSSQNGSCRQPTKIQHGGAWRVLDGLLDLASSQWWPSINNNV